MHEVTPHGCLSSCCCQLLSSPYISACLRNVEADMCCIGWVYYTVPRCLYPCTPAPLHPSPGPPLPPCHMHTLYTLFVGSARVEGWECLHPSPPKYAYPHPNNALPCSQSVQEIEAEISAVQQRLSELEGQRAQRAKQAAEAARQLEESRNKLAAYVAVCALVLGSSLCWAALGQTGLPYCRAPLFLCCRIAGLLCWTAEGLAGVLPFGGVGQEVG